MPESLEEMGAFIDGLRSKHQYEANSQRAVQAQVAKSMAELIADPRWALYVRHLEELRTPQQKALDATRAELEKHLMSNHDYIQTKARQIEAKAKVEALSQAIELVNELIQRGKAPPPDGHS